MSQEKGSSGVADSQTPKRHAEWVREHPRIGESGFPDYPDDPARRGSSRGATPNGNPWRPVNPEERPGRVGSREGSSTPAESRAAPEPYLPFTPRAPEDAIASLDIAQPAVVRASNAADERIGRSVANLLSASKSLEGTHIIVEVIAGEVYLRGAVADSAIKNEAGQLARAVPTAKRVHNGLTARDD